MKAPVPERELLELEHGFWTGDAGFYRQHLAPEPLLVFGGTVGVLHREATIESITAGARWDHVEVSGVLSHSLRDDVVLVTYRAVATRAGAETPYAAHVSSVYVRHPDGWKLTFHQHTPD